MKFNNASFRARLIKKGKRVFKNRSLILSISKFILPLLLVGLLLPGGKSPVIPVQAQGAEENVAQAGITIHTGKYQISEDLLLGLQAGLDELGDRSGNATFFGVGYYEEHARWAWIELIVANGLYFDPDKMGPSFLYFGIREENGWRVVLANNDQEFQAALDSIPRNGLSLQDSQSLDGYYLLNRPDPNSSALTGDLLFPWSGMQNSWRVSPYGYHAAGFESLGMEKNSEAIDLLPPSSALPARVLAMQGGTVVKKLECTWNTVLIVRHDGYPDPKRFLYLHLQNGTSPVGTGTVIQKGQYLGDLRTPVFNGYWSNGSCTTQGSGAFDCERDVNPSTQSLCSYSNARHLHLGFGTDRSILIDGNEVGKLTLGGTYQSTNQDTNAMSFEDDFTSQTLDSHWHWYSEDPTHWDLTAAPGSLRIVTQPGDISAGTNTAPLLLRPLQLYAGPDFDIRTRVSMTPTSDSQQGGLIVYGSYDNYVRLAYVYKGGQKFEFSQEVAGTAQSMEFPSPAGANDFYLRIVKLGKTYLAYYSRNGTDWTFLGRQTNVNIAPLEVGLFAYNGADGSSTGIPADFDFFRIVSKLPVFGDVSVTHPFYPDVEVMYANSLTAGCSQAPLKFCPDRTMNRGEAAVFILRGTFGSGFVPGSATHFFMDDWSKNPWAEPWAEAMRFQGISAGCQTLPVLKYCPWNQIPREQAVIFVVRLKYGIDYRPPAATGTVFADMTDPNGLYTAWAERAYKDGLIPDCGTSGGKPKICPKALVSRGLAAYMIVRAKNLAMP
jgi:hypothetical protein